MDILTQIADLWHNKKDELLKSSHSIVDAMEESIFTHNEGDVSEEALHKAFNYYENNFDVHYVGFGNAPKFPTPHNLYFLLRYWRMTKNPKALEMVEKTLESMYRGGIYDHIGFGFSRYSTDKKWLIPHFEKMLYDNSLLAIAYLEAYQATHNEFYAKAAREIFTYVLRDMTAPEGGFYSAEDADSEGEEGKFYLWSPEEIIEVLGEDAGKKYCEKFDISSKGNFEGKSIPNLIGDKKIGGYEAEGNKLFLNREKRIHPFKDDKVLTAWNGLMIAALAFGSRVLGEELLLASAESSLDFILTKLRREDGRLLARYRDGEAAIPAFVDDYAFLIWGLIELHQASFKPKYLDLAIELNNQMLELFWDEKNGGLYQYGSDSEELISRPKELYDGAMPSGNSVAAVNFLRLAALTGNQELSEKAVAQLKSFGGTIGEQPMGHTHFLIAVYLNRNSLTEVTLVGNIEDSDITGYLSRINSSFLPEVITTFKDISEFNDELEKLTPSLENIETINKKATAYVCKNFSCLPPVSNVNELAQLLQ